MVTTFQGTVLNGQVQLADGVRLPEKAQVYIVVPNFEPDPEPQADARSFDLAEMVARMPTDYQAGEEGFGPPVGKEEW